MKQITVQASASYSVYIGRGILSQLPQLLRSVTKASRLCIVSDHTVWSLYGDDLKDSLTDAGYHCVGFTFPAGEASKNGANYLRLLEFLAQNQLTRSDCLIALGGGVVGDLTGFAAATYLRGIDFVQLPTTLLAAVDSSVGGKTAIDLAAGKNLAGAFYQPRLVLCDTDTLSTLPADIFLDGCAEVIKYGVLYDAAMFDRLMHDGPAFDREAIIARCVELKRDVVAQDEFDTGLRMKLNLGHTVGHGIEAGSRFAVSHGKAVAIGMAIVARASNCPDKDRIVACLQRFGLPVSTDIPADEIYHHALSDKKRSGGTVKLIIPKAIGNCAIVSTPVEQLKSFIEEGL